MTAKGKSFIGKAYRVLLQQETIPHYRAELFRELSRSHRVQVEFVADPRTNTPFLEPASWEEGEVIRFFASRCFRRWVRNKPFSFQPQALRIAYQGDYDAIIAQGTPYSLTTWLLILLGKMKDVPVLLWTHGLTEEEHGLKWAIRAAQFRLADGLLLYGDHARSLLKSKGLASDMLHVVYNSLDVKTQDKAFKRSLSETPEDVRKRLGINEAERVLIFVGRLQPVKKLDQIVAVVRRFRDMGRRVHALFIGDGIERQKLIDLAEQLGVGERIHMLGSTLDEDILASAFRAADLSLIPSGAGLSVMHALVYGTPVVTHSLLSRQFPEVEAVEEGTTGFLYRIEDLESLMSTLERALFPVSCKDSLSNHCRDMIVNRYNPRNQSERIVQGVLKTILRREAHNGMAHAKSEDPA